MQPLGQYIEERFGNTTNDWMRKHPDVQAEIEQHPEAKPSQVFSWLNDEMPDHGLSYDKLKSWMRRLRGQA